MKSGTIFLLLGLLALWAELPPAAGGSPGACPKPTGPGICAELCSGDESCPPGEKCCSNGCGHVCMRAITTGTPGFCPRPTGLGGCAVRCRSDVQCFRGHKCCRTRCGGYVCTKAVRETVTCISPSEKGACRKQVGELLEEADVEPPCP